MEKSNIYLHSDWYHLLEKEIVSENFKSINLQLNKEQKKFTILPDKNKVFNAFNTTPFNKLKVIIIGQDPYHSKGQANGLAFSVPKGNKMPPSLRNIYKELAADLGIINSYNTDLSGWAKQGVLLLNSTLTVRENEPNSHKKIGWELFTDSIIKIITLKKKNLIFLLWGKHAQKKIPLINPKKHHILTANHPSPLSAYRGFFGCKHFSKTNKILIQNNQKPINWKLCKEQLNLF